VQGNSSEPARLHTDALERHPAARAVLENGAVAGMLGALVVAVWFFALDSVQSRPFFTPTLLGSVVFAGAGAEEVQSVNAIMAFAYTGLHGLLYLIAGTVLAWMFQQADERPQFGMILILLFVLSQAVLFGLEVTVVPRLVGVLGAFSVILANVLSAIAMFWFLLQRHPMVIQHMKEAMEDRQ
jgi:hypothetical protein